VLQVILTSEAVVKPKADHDLFEYETIPIPRRPHWDEDTTHEMLDRAEREAFMKWRRVLADMEESSDARQVRGKRQARLDDRWMTPVTFRFAPGRSLSHCFALLCVPCVLSS